MEEFSTSDYSIEETSLTSWPATLPSGKTWPKISIVTPTYNYGHFLEESILSVINQHYPNLEYILIDGGSTDETINIIEKYKHHFSYWVSEPDEGQSDAINKGMAHATGDIVTWLNSDDRLARGALGSVAMGFEISGADIVCGACSLERNGTLFSHHLTSCVSSDKLPLEKLLDIENYWYAGNFFYQPEVMFTRAIWEQAGSYIRNDLHYSMDYELWVRFALMGARIHVVGRPNCIYKMHKDQKSFDPLEYLPELKSVSSEFQHDLRIKINHASITNILGSLIDKLKPKQNKAQNLRIVMLNDVGFNHGAGIAHRRIAQALAWAGHNIHSICLKSLDVPPEALKTVTNIEIMDAIEAHDPDLVIVGNLHGALKVATVIDLIASRWHTWIVMHDLWWLTGRCAYTDSCKKYLIGCDDSCPTPDQYPALDSHLISDAWQTKRRILADNSDKITLLGYSDWVYDFALSTLSNGNMNGRVPRIERFNLGLPTAIFHPRDKIACRDRFGIPRNRFVVLVAACDTYEPRKGAKDVAAALELCDIPDLYIVGAGWIDPEAECHFSEIHTVGYLNEESDMAALYSAADIFVGASREETFGQVYLEAAACGTPVISYDVMGIRDSVKPNVTGLLCEAFDISELARTIRTLYEDDQLRSELGRWAPIYVQNENSLISMYHSLHGVMNRIGLLDNFRSRTKIDLLPEQPELLQINLDKDDFHKSTVDKVSRPPLFWPILYKFTRKCFRRFRTGFIGQLLNVLRGNTRGLWKLVDNHGRDLKRIEIRISEIYSQLNITNGEIQRQNDQLLANSRDLQTTKEKMENYFLQFESQLNITNGEIQRQNDQLLASSRDLQTTKEKTENYFLYLESFVSKSLLPENIPSLDRYILQKLAFSQKDVFFVQIGAHDGLTLDALHTFVVKQKWRGLLVEPVKEVFDRLLVNKSGQNGLIFENAAICEHNGTEIFFHVNQSILSKYPEWTDMLGSFSRNTIMKAQDSIPDIEDYIEERQVLCLTFPDLLKKHNVERIDLLLIDAESFDYMILKQLNFDQYQPKLIIYEHKHLTELEEKTAKQLLTTANYTIKTSTENTIALSNEFSAELKDVYHPNMRVSQP